MLDYSAIVPLWRCRLGLTCMWLFTSSFYRRLFTGGFYQAAFYGRLVTGDFFQVAFHKWLFGGWGIRQNRWDGWMDGWMDGRLGCGIVSFTILFPCIKKDVSIESDTLKYGNDLYAGVMYKPYIYDKRRCHQKGGHIVILDSGRCVISAWNRHRTKVSASATFFAIKGNKATTTVMMMMMMMINMMLLTSGSRTEREAY